MKRNSEYSIKDQVIGAVRKLGIARPRDIATRKMPSSYLHRLAKEGVLERVGRGLYRIAGEEISERQSLAEACKRVPRGVICLLSALQFHEITTQNPFEVWIAIGIKTWRPTIDYPPLKIVRFSGAALEQGIITKDVDGVTVRVYDAAKTVADCFKYRNKIGLDVALEALREYRRQRRSMDELWRYAEICRVAKGMRPYMEALP
ncbi:MAG: type IV toxin-antitoxin system AbiEi family antitoxin domain-containing protein [Pseudomonadota bacterium]